MGNAQRKNIDDGNTPVIEWTLGDRLAKALRIAGIANKDMADIIGVSRNTVSNYINDHTEPSKLAMKEWAMRTGVPLTWLETGANLRPEAYKPAVSGELIHVDFASKPSNATETS